MRFELLRSFAVAFQLHFQTVLLHRLLITTPTLIESWCQSMHLRWNIHYWLRETKSRFGDVVLRRVQRALLMEIITIFVYLWSTDRNQHRNGKWKWNARSQFLESLSKQLTDNIDLSLVSMTTSFRCIVSRRWRWHRWPWLACPLTLNFSDHVIRVHSELCCTVHSRRMY